MMKRLTYVLLLLLPELVCVAQTNDETETAPPLPGQPKIISAKPVPPLHLPDTIELVKDLVIGKGGARDLHADILQPKVPRPCRCRRSSLFTAAAGNKVPIIASMRRCRWR